MVIGINLFRKLDSKIAIGSSKNGGKCATVGADSDTTMHNGFQNLSYGGVRALFQTPSLGPFASVTQDAKEYQTINDTKIQKRLDGMLYPLLLIVVVSWLLAAFGASWVWIILLIGFVWAYVKGVLDKLLQDYIRTESLRIHRKRALQYDETCEWLNLLLNRWSVFSSTSIFLHLKKILDPKLLDIKPSFLESINLKTLDLGNRTPYIKSVKSWDPQTRSPSRYRSSTDAPLGLSESPAHTVALLCDVIFDSQDFSAVLATRLGHKGVGVELDVGIEKLSVEGQILLTLFLDSQVSFPHVARITFSFVERPKVDFRVKILKSVQMMEMPVLKSWISNLVDDALATAWVDPGQLEINIRSNGEEFVPRQRPGDLFAHGVLTVVVRIHNSSVANFGGEDDKWLVIGLGEKTHISSSLTSPLWQFSCSFLLTTPLSTTNLVLKVKTKRLITTTLAQYDLPLNQYAFEQSKIAEVVLQKRGTKVMGGNVPPFHIRMEYSPLVPINFNSEITTTDKKSNVGAGVLYIMVHGADNLSPSAGFSPSPYCLVFSSRKKVKTTHYVSECSNPRWECGAQVLVSDVCCACITFVVCSLPTNPKMSDGELLGIQTVNLSTVNLPLIRKQITLNRNISSPFSTTQNEATKSSMLVSVVFQSVASISGCDNVSENVTAPLGNSSPSSGHAVNTPTGGNPSPTSSTGQLEEEERKKKHWLQQAKSLLGSGIDSEIGHKQDLENILASGLGLIELTIVKARDLVARDLNGFSDPYCVVKVNGELKYRTRVRKKTLHPIWEESLMTHLPNKNQALVITLWDHDAFGKDFLGSVTLQEEKVRSLSVFKDPSWCDLEGVKTGALQLRIKLISEDCQFVDSTDAGRDETGGNSSTVSSGDDSETILLPRSESFKLSLPNRTSCLKAPHSNVLLRTSSNPSLNNCVSSKADDDESADLKYKALCTSLKRDEHSVDSKYKALCTPLRRRKTGAEIVASALEEAKKSTESLNNKNVKILDDSNRCFSNGGDKNHLSSLKKENNLSCSEIIAPPPPPPPIESLDIVVDLDRDNVEERLGNQSSSSSNYEIESMQSLPRLGIAKKMKKYRNFSKNFPKDSQDLSPVCSSLLPRISVNDHSEDDFGLTDDDDNRSSSISEETAKVLPVSEESAKILPVTLPRQKRKKHRESKGLKAVKEKLRRFRLK